RSTGERELPGSLWRGDVNRRSDQQPGAAFRLVFFPEPFQVFADRFDARRPRVGDARRPAHRRDQVNGVTFGVVEWVLKEDIAGEACAAAFGAGDQAAQQYIRAAGLMQDATARCQRKRRRLNERDEQLTLL